MLTQLNIHNFKRFDTVEIELGNPVVFIGPNNSGKTSAMQALALWYTGLHRWLAKHSRPDGVIKNIPKRPGATVNRKDTLAIPVPSANLLWRGLHTRTARSDQDGKKQMNNVRIDLIVEGLTQDKAWSCGLEFDYANTESFYCRPLRIGEGPERMPVPSAARKEQIAFLPPMSGLAATETRLDHGAVNVRVGEGRTAEVLRNLCYKVLKNNPDRWQSIETHIEQLFGVQLDEPCYIHDRGEIVMSYREQGVQLDLCASGRGLQQTLLILAYMYANPGSVILLDEPDAHLEILRQRQIYKLLSDTAEASGSQVIAASHSEVLLNEAAGKDLVVAFVGKPHSIGAKKSQVHKALTEVGFEQYAQAKQTKWVLYLEGSTDLSVLQAFAKRLQHTAAEKALERPFVHYVANQVSQAKKHFYALKEAVPKLRGLALFDRLDDDVSQGERGLRCIQWQRREIENYICTRSTLEAYAKASSESPQATALPKTADQRLRYMREAIQETEEALQKLHKDSPWTTDGKVSDEFLTPLFQTYFQKLGWPNLMSKKSFHELAQYVPENEISPEVKHKLDAIGATASRS